jgi:hypothetical protein
LSSDRGNFTSAKRAHTVNSIIALTTTKKGDLFIAEYMNKMRFLGNELAATGKPIDDDELISYIFADLDFEYNLVVTTLLAKEVLMVGDVYSKLLSFEQCLALQGAAEHYSMAVTCGRGTTHGRGGPRGDGCTHNVPRPQGRGSGRGNFNRSNLNQDNRPKCQLCGRSGHLVIDYWHRYDESYVADDKYEGATTASSGVDSNWYTDTGSIDHVTGEIEKLTVRDKYKGNDQVTPPVE